MKRRLLLGLLCAAALEGLNSAPGRAAEVRLLDPPEQGFYAKVLDYDGIPIKAAAVVADQALLIARERLTRLLRNLPDARYNLRLAGAELHIIGTDQVTSDLPEHRHLKGKPFDGNLTVDQRTRGLGGLLTSCGEENLLELPTDRYRGRDICLHEFAHNLQGQGLSEDVRRKIREQYRRSLDAGLWKGAYAASNEGEYFAELTMWYFGTHGDLNIQGPRPENGPEGLRKYDPPAFALLDDLYSGRLPIERVKIRELPAQAPAQETVLRSGSDGTKTSIRFVNRTAGELKRYWLDGEGKRRAYGVVPAGGSVTQGTFATHVWLLAGADDRAIALFVAEPGQGLATVK